MLMATADLLPNMHFRAIPFAVLGRTLVAHEPTLHLAGRLRQMVALRVRLPRNIRGRDSVVKEPPPFEPPPYLHAITIAGPLLQLPFDPVVEMTAIRRPPRLFLRLRLFDVPAALAELPPAGLPPVELLPEELLLSPPVLDDPSRDALELPTVLLTVPSVVDRTVRATMTVSIDSIVVMTESTPFVPPLWNAFITVTTVSIMLTVFRTVVTPPMTGTKSRISFKVLKMMFMTL